MIFLVSCGCLNKNRYSLRFEVFTAVNIMNDIFCDVMPCNLFRNGRFRGMYHFHHEGEKHPSISSYCLVPSSLSLSL
jgi:hypothetical protein